jgi:hypothetical protein
VRRYLEGREDCDWIRFGKAPKRKRKAPEKREVVTVVARPAAVPQSPPSEPAFGALLGEADKGRPWVPKVGRNGNGG